VDSKNLYKNIHMIKNREDLIKWALRALGHPVLHINVTDEQMEDRLDDTLELFQEYNIGGTTRDFLRYQVTEEDIYNQYIPIDGSSVIGIVRLIPVPNALFGQTDIVFDPIYQLLQGARGMWSTIDLTSYTMFREFGETLDLILKPRHDTRFNRYQNKLFIDWHWGNRDWNEKTAVTERGKTFVTEEEGLDIQLEPEFNTGAGRPDIYPNDFIILECYKVLDPDEYPLVYNDRWLKEYYKAMVKLQWGQNLSKFSGMTLPGGVQLDGNAMMSDANAELDKLKEQLYTDYQEPLGFIIG